jgi:hypothetical protein
VKVYYLDILEGMDEEPKWFDEHGVPRYCEFHPSQVGLYADEAALLLIACQNCGQTFKVAMCWDYHDPPPTSLLGMHYGDPPNVRCCPAGPTMNCNDLKVLEWWDRERPNGWQRIKEKEILLPDHPEYKK